MVLEKDLMTVVQARKVVGTCVYALCDQKGEAFYVGQTRRPWQRFREHARKNNRGLNGLAAKRYAGLGEGVRVSILHLNPHDLDAAECEEIVRRPWTKNVVVPGHFRWQQPRAVEPWVFAGTSPSRFLLQKLRKAKQDSAELYVAIRGVPEELRFQFEIEVFSRDVPKIWRHRLNAWADCVMMLGPIGSHLLWHEFLVAHGEAKAEAAYGEGLRAAMGMYFRKDAQHAGA